MRSQKKYPAIYMRGGTSKGVFFRADVVPTNQPERDELFLRVLGSPDPYEKQVDGMGGATSSTSKVVIIGPSEREDCDVNYLYGAVSVDSPVVDYSGSCGNLSAAVAPFAIHERLISAPKNGIATVKIWQANTGKRIIAKVPMRDGEVVELGDFTLDGVTFPAAEVVLDFLDPADNASGLFPTGNVVDNILVPEVGNLNVTLINAGNAHIFINAEELDLKGTEFPDEINNNSDLLKKFETIRAYCAVVMGLADCPKDATKLRPHTPKLAFVTHSHDFTSSARKQIKAADFDITARILSMGKLHHAITGTGGIALATASAIKGTIVNQIISHQDKQLRIGHPSGLMTVGATANSANGEWSIEKVTMSRSARRLMEGWVLA